MNIAEVNSSLETISLPADQKRAIVQLIDTKTNSDMKEVLAKLDHMEIQLQTRFQLIHDKLSNEIKTVYWVIGVAMTAMLFMVARK